MDKSEYGGIIGHNKEWKDKRLDCDYCEYNESGFIREYYPHAGLTPLSICPECGCGNEYAVARGNPRA